MRRATWQVAVLAAGLVGCATLTSAFHSEREDRFKSGLRALSNGDYQKARTELSWVVQHAADKDEGQRALLVMGALEIDPRNPTRRTDVGADVVANFLELRERDAWVDPVAQTLYLVALELGAAEQRAERAEQQVQQQRRELPTLPGPTVTSRIRNAEQDRDRLAKRVAALEAQLADREKELERIRKTIKP